MVECPRASQCNAFFKDQLSLLFNLSDIFKQQYCFKDYAKCARFMLLQKLGLEKVPHDLFPNEMKRAEEILRAAGA